MAYLFPSLALLSVLLFFLISRWRRSPVQKLAAILGKIDRQCAATNFFYSDHSVDQQHQYAIKLAGTLRKLVDRLGTLEQAIAYGEQVKAPLEMFIKKWTREAIADSLFTQDGRFMSDKNYLLQFVPYRNRWKWKTLFPMFKP